MKKTKLGMLLAGALIIAGAQMSYGEGNEMQLVNEQHFTPSEVSSIRLDYDYDDITLLESATADIVLKEYMDTDKSTYYAHIENRDGVLSISEGLRPRGNRLDCNVELYLPAGYEADVSIHTTESTLKTQISHTLSALRTETTHGTLEITDIKAQTISISSANGTANLSNVEADTLSFHTTNATVIADNVHGQILYGTSNGKLILTTAYGSGTFDVTSNGALNLTFAEITGNIKASSKNSDIHFIAPKDAAFHFAASSRNGSVNVSYDGVVVNDGQAAGDVGNDPQLTVELEARNGNIEAK